MNKLYKAIVINPKSNFQVDVFPEGALLVSKEGKIIDCGDFDLIVSKHSNLQLFDYSGKILLPGLIDLHTHLPQFTAIGKNSSQLLDWLNNSIFPTETKFSDKETAFKYSKLFFDNLIRSGTTTAAIYSSNNKDATDITFEIAHSIGIYALIGKTMMDQNTPIGLTQTAKENINESLNIASKWHNKGKLRYILTPRFAASCSPELMKLTAEVAQSDGFFIQTHLAENLKELELIQQLYGDSENYTDVYRKSGILTNKTILAHCIYLNNNELSLIKQSGSIIAHCPTSNRYLGSGIMPLVNYLQNYLRLGLGTDVAAGYSLSVLSEAREAIENSKYYSLFVEETKWLSPEEAISLATIKSAECLQLENEIGNFEVGKSADFVIFNLPDFFVDINDRDAILAATIYNLEKPFAVSVFIDGSKVL